MSTEPPDDDINRYRVNKVERELRAFRTETTARFDAIDGRFDEHDRRFDILEQRMVDTELRLSTELRALSGTLAVVHKLIVGRRKRPAGD